MLSDAGRRLEGDVNPLLIHEYAVDGALLYSGQLARDKLSARWVQLWRDLLDARGPVFACSLGSTLTRFSVDSVPGICHFKVDDTVVYIAAVLPSDTAENYQTSLGHFAGLLDSRAHFHPPERCPAFLVLNLEQADIAAVERDALFELAYHYAGAYLDWIGA